jgi:intein-encoded DNA endonuclease-like protein
LIIGQSAEKTFAYLLGVYLGDGCVTTSGYESSLGRQCYVFRLNTIDRDFAEATADALLDLTGKRPNIRQHPVKKGSDNYAMSHACRELTDRLVADTQDKSIIPAYVFTWADNMKREFIAGLMDSEGFVSMNSYGTAYMGFKSCDLWVSDFVRILQSVGVQIGKIGVEQPRKPGYKTPRRFTVKMRSWVDSGCRFNIQRKQQRVDAWAEKVFSETNMPNAPQGVKIEPELA